MKIAVKILFVVFALAGVVSIIHWVNHHEVGVWGGISVFFLLCFLWFLLFAFLQSQKIISRELLTNMTVLLLTFFVAYVAVEFSLRGFAKSLRSYGERNGNPCYHALFDLYLQPCDSCWGGLFYINQPLGSEEFSKSEFHYLHRYNSLGLRDHEFVMQKDTNEFRVLGVGDSFTEGVGTAADSTWLKQLEYLLNAHNDTTHFTTLNGGAHGNDLFFSYDFLSKCLLKYKPDLVILNLNSTDVNDILLRGCYERFDSHGNFVGKQGPWWEFIFGSSYTARLILLNGLHYNWQLQTELSQRKQEEEIVKQMAQKLKDYQQLANENHFRFLLLTHPLQEELRDSNNILSRLVIDTAITHIDLTESLNSRIQHSEETMHQYYWPIDGHFKTAGYGLEAEEIYRNYFVAKKKKL